VQEYSFLTVAFMDELEGGEVTGLMGLLPTPEEASRFDLF